MDQPANLIADRYHLVLDRSWHNWFQDAASTLPFPGAFQTPVSLDALVASRPEVIWPGFMLPDTLPIIGNQYGDWICARVTEDDRLGELVHWYHGGGDWIPVGENLEQALLHDVVDQYRPLRQQMLRGAFETLAPDHLQGVSDKLENSHFKSWLSHGLAGDDQAANARLLQIVASLQQGDYSAALHLLLESNWAYAATACDLVEEALQRPRSHIAPATRPPGTNNNSAFIRWLFDSESFPRPINVPNGLPIDDDALPAQDWRFAKATCHALTQRRQDLGWAFDILGWCYQRAGEMMQALDAYGAGRFASSFSNQAVRLRTHWFDQRYGKFSTAQLATLSAEHFDVFQGDPYLEVVRQAPAGGLLPCVQAYWQQTGDHQLHSGDAASAYVSYYRAGWDLGAAQLEDYHELLQSLALAASRAGWRAREQVARTHLRCLESRTKKSE